MGMASSQARLLSLTSRQHSIELKAQVLQAQKLQLANDSDAAYDNYLKTLDATKLQTKLFNQDGKQAWVDASVNNLMRINSPETYGNTFFVKNIDDGKIYLPQSVAEKYESANGDEERFLQLYGITRSNEVDTRAKDAAKAKLDADIANGWDVKPKYEDFGITAEFYSRYKDFQDNFTDARTVRNVLAKYYSLNGSSNTLTNDDYIKLSEALNSLSSTEFASSDANLTLILGGYHSISDTYGCSFEATGYYSSNMPNIKFEPTNSDSYLHQVDTWTKDAVVQFTSTNGRTDVLDQYSGVNTADGTNGEVSGVKILSDNDRALLYLAGGSYNVTYQQRQRHVLYYLSGNGDWDTACDLGNNKYNKAETESGVSQSLWSDDKNSGNIIHDNTTYGWYYGQDSEYIKYLQSLNDNKPSSFQGHDLNWGTKDGFLDYDVYREPEPETTVTLVAENIYSNDLLNAINTYLNGSTYEKNAAGALDKFTNDVLSYEQYADEVAQYDTAYDNYVQYTVDLQAYNNTQINEYIQYNNSVSGPYYENLFKAIQLSDGYHVISSTQAKDGDWVNSMARSGKVVLTMYDTEEKDMNDYSAFSHQGLQEVANDGEVAVADVEYENALDAINSKELKLSRRLSRLETERAAIKIEIDSIKQIRNDNINVAFKVFG